ncbi:MAG: flippase-like domain-containing protein [Bdellovibrionales bacterium]|nr:flippase-like domain-containing protein [Bdellovibrionales bacterium]
MNTFILKMFVTLGLLLAIFLIVDLSAACKTLQNGKPVYLLLSFAFLFCTRILMPLKWRYLFRQIGEEIGSFESFYVYSVSSFIGQFFPATVGGDVSRALLLKQKGYRLVPVIASILYERVLGLGVTMLFALASSGILVFFFSDHATLQLDYLFGGLLLFGIVLLLSFSFRSVQARAINRALVIFQGKLKRRIEQPLVVSDFLSLLVRMGPRVPLFASLTGLEFVLSVLGMLFCCLAFVENFDFLAVSLVIPVHFLLSRVPVTISGFGWYEASIGYLLSQVGVPLEIGLTVGFVHHILLCLALLPGVLLSYRDSTRTIAYMRREPI